jgi:hypothetical protein
VNRASHASNNACFSSSCLHLASCLVELLAVATRLVVTTVACVRAFAFRCRGIDALSRGITRDQALAQRCHCNGRFASRRRVSVVVQSPMTVCRCCCSRPRWQRFLCRRMMLLLLMVVVVVVVLDPAVVVCRTPLKLFNQPRVEFPVRRENENRSTDGNCSVERTHNCIDTMW